MGGGEKGLKGGKERNTGDALRLKVGLLTGEKFAIFH